MSWQLYVSLSLMMFLQFAIWGSWTPVLASHLVGPLRMSGKQTGWIYATMWLGCIVSPFIGSQITDRWMATEYFLAIVQLAGGVVLLLAARMRRFWPLFAAMGIYALLYAPTLALVNSLMFSNLDDSAKQAGSIRVWGTIGWIAAGLLLSLWRRSGRSNVKGSDALILAGVFSLMMGVFCFFLPHTPPPASPGNPLAFVEAFKMLQDPNILIFLIISFVVTTQLQFYYVATAPFLEEIGVQRKNVSAVMTLAQFAEMFGLAFLLKLLLPVVGYRWALAIGVLAWPLRYIIFAMMRPVWLVIVSLMSHGLGYVFFFFVGQMYIDKVAPPDIKASAQALLAVVTFGMGSFIGTQITGVVMDLFKTEGKFRWRPIFLVPCVLTIICAAAFILFFRG
jgi:nucleoside transporter